MLTPWIRRYVWLRYQRHSSKIYEPQISSTLVCDQISLHGKFSSEQPRKRIHDPEYSPSFSANLGPTSSHYRSVTAVTLALQNLPNDAYSLYRLNLRCQQQWVISLLAYLGHLLAPYADGSQILPPAEAKKSTPLQLRNDVDTGKIETFLINLFNAYDTSLSFNLSLIRLIYHLRLYLLLLRHSKIEWDVQNNVLLPRSINTTLVQTPSKLSVLRWATRIVNSNIGNPTLYSGRLLKQSSFLILPNYGTWKRTEKMIQLPDYAAPISGFVSMAITFTLIFILMDSLQLLVPGQRFLSTSPPATTTISYRGPFPRRSISRFETNCSP